MKRIKTFESFREFFTGHKSGVDKDNSKARIEAEIEDCIEKYKNDLSIFVKYDENSLREKLLKKAKEDNYRGRIKVQQASDPKSMYHNKFFINYETKNSPLQDLGSSASNATEVGTR